MRATPDPAPRPADDHRPAEGVRPEGDARPAEGARPGQGARPGGDARAFDLLVAGDAVPDVIVGDVAGELAFGQAETLVSRGALTVGGSSAIMACGAARLGLRVAFVGVVGDDAAGRFMLDELTARGVDVSACVVLPGRATGLTVHLVRPGGERDRAMLTSLGCVGELTAAMVRSAHPEHARHLHVGSFYLLPGLAPDLAGLFAEVRAAGCGTSLDTQGDWEGRWQGGLREVLRETDLYLPNRDEALAVAASLGGESPVEAGLEGVLETLAALGPRPVVKCGAQGAVVLDGAAVVRAAALPAAPDRHDRRRRQLRRRIRLRPPAGLAGRPQSRLRRRVRVVVDARGGRRRRPAAGRRGAEAAAEALAAAGQVEVGADAQVAADSEADVAADSETAGEPAADLPRP